MKQSTKLIVLSCITTVLYLVLMLGTIPHLTELAQGQAILDAVPFGYDTAYVKSLFTSLSEQGRNFYIFVQLPLDFIYPPLLGYTGYLLIRASKIKYAALRRVLYLFPIFAFVFDYLENIGVFVLLQSFPKLLTSAVSFTSVMSIAKSVTVSLTLLTLLCLAATAITRAVLRRNRSQQQR